MVLDKKQIWVIFLLKFDMGCKAETVHTDNTFGPGTPREHEVTTGTKVSKTWSAMADQFRAVSKPLLL